MASDGPSCPRCPRCPLYHPQVSAMATVLSSPNLLSSLLAPSHPTPEWGCCYTRSVLSAFSALSIRSAVSTPVLPCIRCLHRQSLCQLAVRSEEHTSELQS